MVTRDRVKRNHAVRVSDKTRHSVSRIQKYMGSQPNDTNTIQEINKES